MPGKKKVLLLKNVNAKEIILRYYPEETKETRISLNCETDISSLLYERSKRCIYFLDQYKNKIRYWVNMIEYTQNGALPLYTTKPCWWCTNTFTTHPIGCPIEYHSKKEGETKERIQRYFKELNYPSEKIEFFVTIGLFCSFPCIKGYIYDQLSRGNKSLYKNSLTLLSLLYEKIFGEKITIPTASCPRRVLKKYGGHFTPEEYRASFGKLEYTETANLRKPLMFSSSKYIQETQVRL